MGQINNIAALVQIMSCCRPGDKPLSEPMTIRLLTSLGLNELILYQHLIPTEAMTIQLILFQARTYMQNIFSEY